MKRRKIATLLCVFIAMAAFVGAPVAQAAAESERILSSYGNKNVIARDDSAPLIKPEGNFVGAPLLNLNEQATVLVETNMVGQPNGVAVGSTVTMTLANPDFLPGAASGQPAPARIVVTGAVRADRYIVLNMEDADRNALWTALNVGGAVNYAVTDSTPAFETLGIPEDQLAIGFLRPGAANLVRSDPEYPNGLRLPVYDNWMLIYVDDVPAGTVEVVDADGKAVPGSWDFTGNADLADLEDGQPDTVEGGTEKLPIPTVQQLIQPGTDANGHTSNQIANLNVEIGVAPGVYEVTYDTATSSLAAIKLTIYVTAIWPATPVIDVGETITLTAYGWKRLPADPGTWTLPDATVGIVAPTTSLENTNTITLVGQAPTSAQVGLVLYESDNVWIPRLMAKVTVQGLPSIDVKDGVDLTITDSTELGKILSGPALTATKDGNRASEVEKMVTLTRDDAAYTLRLVNAQDEVLTADDIVGTGCKIELIEETDNDEVLETVTIVVRGDVNGSGVISLTQLVRMTTALKDASQLSTLDTLAGDLDGSGAINLTDLVQEATLYRASMAGAVATPTPAPTMEPSVAPDGTD